MKRTYLWRTLILTLLTVALFVALACIQTVSAENKKTDYDFSGIYLNRDSVRIKLGGSFTVSTRVIGKLSGNAVYESADKSVATAPKSAEWVWKKASGYFPSNINFMLNISPDETGKVDENLIAAFEAVGKGMTFPAPLTELPDGWLTR